MSTKVTTARTSGATPLPASNNPFAVRLPPSLREWLASERERTGVSVNATIIKAVEQYRNRVNAANSRKEGNGTGSR